LINATGLCCDLGVLGNLEFQEVGLDRNLRGVGIARRGKSGVVLVTGRTIVCVVVPVKN
jgi:hypothetical protein